MNITDKSNTDLLFLNFNQDFSCISVGTKRGYRIYNCDPFGKCYSKAEGGTGIVEMLFCTSLVALVGSGEQPNFSTRHLQIINTKRQSTICELTFPTSILAVKMNRRRLIVVLEEQIFVYDISNMKLLHTIDTNPNPQAICALSPSSENCFIAYPSKSPSNSHFTGGQTTQSYFPTGDVEIFDALSLQLINIVQAHKSPVSCITMNADGTLLATASEKGTVIRVYSIPDATKVYQFRRGSYPAKIYSMSFNLVSSLLCVSSDTETVHIFKLALGAAPGLNGNNGYSPTPLTNEQHHHQQQQQEPEARGRSGSVGQMLRRSSLHFGRNIAGSVGSYLPEMLTEMWEPARDFASLKLPSGSGVRSLVALSSTTPQVMVITSEGYFYQYNIDLENGGECVLLKQNTLLDSSDEANGVLGD
ncbi:WD40-repeat-containing domain protein [Halteromyces radiatus]|uniref:WD40-repeat-containing domain protein n=1 Tax=Halteromyces radiatus TaxID=101107 RepID=UPI00221F2C01|nr:WD40-repeat-containing domain protein [Halteromyces radiatus]KAI8089007.1 WD40-repeat-containing domain protein [Halteromyces radiatus]